MLTRYPKQFVRYLRNTRAVSALEYAVLIGIVATAVAVAIGLLGTSVNTVIDGATTKVGEAKTEMEKAR